MKITSTRLSVNPYRSELDLLFGSQVRSKLPPSAGVLPQTRDGSENLGTIRRALVYPWAPYSCASQQVLVVSDVFEADFTSAAGARTRAKVCIIELPDGVGENAAGQQLVAQPQYLMFLPPDEQMEREAAGEQHA